MGGGEVVTYAFLVLCMNTKCGSDLRYSLRLPYLSVNSLGFPAGRLQMLATKFHNFTTLSSENIRLSALYFRSVLSEIFAEGMKIGKIHSIGL
jgi:hypothetical protein